MNRKGKLSIAGIVITALGIGGVDWLRKTGIENEAKARNAAEIIRLCDVIKAAPIVAKPEKTPPGTVVKTPPGTVVLQPFNASDPGNAEICKVIRFKPGEYPGLEYDSDHKAIIGTLTAGNHKGKFIVSFTNFQRVPLDEAKVFFWNDRDRGVIFPNNFEKTKLFKYPDRNGHYYPDGKGR